MAGVPGSGYARPRAQRNPARVERPRVDRPGTVPAPGSGTRDPPADGSPVTASADSAHAGPAAVGGAGAVTEIRPGSDVRLWAGDLWRYRGVLWALCRRDVRAKYKQAALGVAWAVLQPAAQVVIFTVVFRGVGGVATEIPYPVWVLASLLPFNLFQQMLSHGAPAFVAQQAIVTKVYFPRIYTVLAGGAHAVINAAVSLVLLGIVMLAHGVTPPATALLALPLLVAVALLAVGGAAVLAAINVRFRDVQHALPLCMTVLLFLSPVLYPLERLPGLARTLAAANPVTGLVEGVRWSLTGVPPSSAALVLGACAASVVVFAAGVLVFERTQARLVDLL